MLGVFPVLFFFFGAVCLCTSDHFFDVVDLSTLSYHILFCSLRVALCSFLAHPLLLSLCLIQSRFGVINLLATTFSSAPSHGVQ